MTANSSRTSKVIRPKFSIPFAFSDPTFIFHPLFFFIYLFFFRLILFSCLRSDGVVRATHPTGNKFNGYPPPWGFWPAENDPEGYISPRVLPFIPFFVSNNLETLVIYSRWIVAKIALFLCVVYSLAAPDERTAVCVCMCVCVCMSNVEAICNYPWASSVSFLFRLVSCSFFLSSFFSSSFLLWLGRFGNRVFLILRIRFFFLSGLIIYFFFGMLLPFVSFRFLRSSSPTDHYRVVCWEQRWHERGSFHLSCIQTGDYKPDDRKYLTASLSGLATNLLYDD